MDKTHSLPRSSKRWRGRYQTFGKARYALICSSEGPAGGNVDFNLRERQIVQFLHPGRPPRQSRREVARWIEERRNHHLRKQSSASLEDQYALLAPIYDADRAGRATNNPLRYNNSPWTITGQSRT